jgi:HK97 gp10 family phage protein
MTAASADLRSLAADLADASGQGIDRAAAEVIRAAATGIMNQARQFAPVKSGKLRDSIHVTFTGPTQAAIGPAVPYGPYQEFGTATRGEYPGPYYFIRPRNAAALSFIGKDGKRVVTQQVKHPGVKPKRYMRRAVEVELAGVADRLAQQGALIITKGPNG